MWVSLGILLLSYVFARDLSTYDELRLFKSHIVLKSKTASYLLVGRFFGKSRQEARKKGNDMKMTLVGVVYYFVIAIAAAVSLIVLFIVPEVSCDYFDYGKMAFRGATYNEKAVAKIAIFVVSLGVGLCTLHSPTQLRNRPYPTKSDASPIIFACLFFLVAAFNFAAAIDAMKLL